MGRKSGRHGFGHAANNPNPLSSWAEWTGSLANQSAESKLRRLAGVWAPLPKLRRLCGVRAARRNT